MATPYDGSIEAEYADGFILTEHENDDKSPYCDKHNIFYAILNKQPEAEHGELVRFSVYHSNKRTDIDWVEVPKNARPIRYKYMERDHNLNGDFLGETRQVGVGFGYQYNDSKGKNQEVIQEF
ncbi:MAG: hypothetical protein QFB87_04560 [Patescibacteria group bacterium]|nr:hypothetical protein [Patescibacteria group bacterium]